MNYLTVKEAAKRVNRTPNTIRTWIKQGYLDGVETQKNPEGGADMYIIPELELPTMLRKYGATKGKRNLRRISNQGATQDR